MKPYTIPDEYEREATLSAWLKMFPFMRAKPRFWGLHKSPISPRCRELYPEIVSLLHETSQPMVINFEPSSKQAIAA